MSESIYLGLVKWVHENEKNYRHAIVEPIAEFSEDQKSWVETIENVTVQFPARGCVYWHNAPSGLVEGDIRQFEVEAHPRYQGEQDKDAFQVKNPRHVIEIIDLRTVGPEPDIRILMTTKGASLKGKPLGGRCMLWVQDEKWVGPVDLVPGAEKGFWVLASDQVLESIRQWKISPQTIQRVELDGTRYLLAPNQENFGQSLGFVNWQLDGILAKRVLDHLRKQDRKAVEALGISKDVFRTYIETIEKAGLLGSSLAQELAFHERIKEILIAISKNEELLEEAAGVCFDIDPVKEKLEEKLEEEYQKRLAERETLLDEDLLTKRAELEMVAGNLSEKREELSTLEERLKALDNELHERTSGFEKELEERLLDIAAKPERLFAEMAIVKALFPRGGPARAKPGLAVRRQIGGASPDIPIVEESTAFMGALSKRLLSSGISPIVGQALHSSLLAGLVPILIGSEAYDVISSYADCVSGGTLHWIPMGGSLFEPSDLLARFDPISRCLVPHPGGLLDLLLDESDAVHIVVLDGFNRAAVDGYLMPLLQSAQDIARGRTPRSIPLAPPGFASEDDPYGGISKIAWNRNVFLVLCPCTGFSTLSVPKEFWTHCTVLCTSDPVPEEVALELGPTSQVTRVPATVWMTWSEGAKGECGPLDILRKQPLEAESLTPIVLGNAERMCASGVFLGLKQERALNQAIKMSLFPYLMATDGPVAVWFQHLGVELNAIDQRIDDTIKRLGV